jgi:hypothetical protein
MNRNAMSLAVMMVVSVVTLASSARASGQSAVPQLVPVENGCNGPYVGQALVIANSVNDWNASMATLEAAGALQVTPAPPAPANVDWSHEVVILVAAGMSGYDVALQLSSAGAGRSALNAVWTPLGNDASWKMPYVMVKTAKRGWLASATQLASQAVASLPVSGTEDLSLASAPVTWGGLKALYR